ncbi:ccdc-47 [Blepharisma stoltei]|uniref:Uncharacterized protein n=1 Tax=Blepharisma stoltei TaxID=1481888 RepID=A0AAU9JX37_9CILI|nr:unnamed protein product [Blepharisma stoltei]
MEFSFTFSQVVPIIVAILAIFIYFFGKNRNKLIAHKWANTLEPFLKENFTNIGEFAGAEYLKQYTNQIFRIMASGRKSCLYFVSIIELTRRHNIIYATIGRFFSSETDRFAFEIVVNVNPPSPVIFALLKNIHKKKIFKEYDDLRILAQERPKYTMPNGFVIMSENDESASWILTNEILHYIEVLAPIIEMIYITDLEILPVKAPLTLRCNFLLPHNSQNKVNSQQIELAGKFALALADRLSLFRISNQARELCLKSRSNLRPKSE